MQSTWSLFYLQTLVTFHSQYNVRRQANLLAAIPVCRESGFTHLSFSVFQVILPFC